MMKKILFLVLALLAVVGHAQVSTTPEGYARLKKKPQETTMAYTDSVIISKVDGIVRGIALLDFLNLIPTSDWSTPLNSDITVDTDNTYNFGTPSFKLGTIYSHYFRGDNAIITDNLVVPYRSLPSGVANGTIYLDFDDDILKARIASAWVNIATEDWVSTNTSDDQLASEVPSTPFTNTSSNNVQDALEEIASESMRLRDTNILAGLNWSFLSQVSGAGFNIAGPTHEASMSGGSSGQTKFTVNNGEARLTGFSNAQIDAVGDDAPITKRYFDANNGAGSYPSTASKELMTYHSTKKILADSVFDARDLYAGRILFITANDTVEAGDAVTSSSYGKFMKIIVKKTDSAYVRPIDNDTIRLMDDGTMITSGQGLVVTNSRGFTLFKEDANNWWASGPVTVHTEVVPPLYEGSNAADPYNEIDGVANITNGGNQTIVSASAVTAQDGTYYVSVTKSITGTTNVYLDTQNILNGDTIEVTGHFYRTSGSTGNVQFILDDAEGWDFDDATNIGDGTIDTWIPITLTATATQDNPRLRIVDLQTVSGVAWYFDNIVYTKTN